MRRIQVFTPTVCADCGKTARCAPWGDYPQCFPCLGYIVSDFYTENGRHYVEAEETVDEDHDYRDAIGDVVNKLADKVKYQGRKCPKHGPMCGTHTVGQESSYYCLECLDESMYAEKAREDAAAFNNIHRREYEQNTAEDPKSFAHCTHVWIASFDPREVDHHWCRKCGKKKYAPLSDIPF